MLLASAGSLSSAHLDSPSSRGVSLTGGLRDEELGLCACSLRGAEFFRQHRDELGSRPAPGQPPDTRSPD